MQPAPEKMYNAKSYNRKQSEFCLMLGGRSLQTFLDSKCFRKNSTNNNCVVCQLTAQSYEKTLNAISEIGSTITLSRSNWRKIFF